MKDGMCSMTFDIIMEGDPCHLQLSWNKKTEELTDYTGNVVGYAKMNEQGFLIPYNMTP